MLQPNCSRVMPDTGCPHQLKPHKRLHLCQICTEVQIRPWSKRPHLRAVDVLPLIHAATASPAPALHIVQHDAIDVHREVH
eukprot:1138135-Pelagomonas_calceolata.AAC.6